MAGPMGDIAPLDTGGAFFLQRDLLTDELCDEIADDHLVADPRCLHGLQDRAVRSEDDRRPRMMGLILVDPG